MLKKETFNLEDSNVAGLGSDLDKKCRETAAATEKAWAKAGKKPGMQVWRIEQFKVKASQTAAGTFYNDDSYICLNTYKCKDMNGKETEKLAWDIHFWLGETTSQDEYGTAAYKTVELDDFLGGGPVQHRECSGYESLLFLSYFKEVKLLEGGVASGFNKIKPEEYRPRLLHLKGRKNVRVQEVPAEYKSLNDGDCFVMDCGFDLYQWQGKKAGKNEKARAAQLCRAIDDERSGKPEVHVYTQGDSDEKEFFATFKEYKEGEIPTIAADDVCDAAWETASEKSLWQLSDASGSLEFKEVAKTKVTKDKLNDKDVFIFDIGCEVFAWVGKGASDGEKKGALNAAQQYLKKAGKSPKTPISKILDGAENEVFNSSFDRA